MLAVAFILSTFLGFIAGALDIPPPAPNQLFGAAIVVAITSGFVVFGFVFS